jgi:hypothetical protein
MLIRLEPTFINTVKQLNQPFSEVDKEKLSELIELNYNKVRAVISAEEQDKEKSKPTAIELGNIGTRFFALSLYYTKTKMIYLILFVIYFLLFPQYVLM